MKRIIMLLGVIIGIPYALCLIFSLCSDEIQIGQGGNTVEHRKLGKEILIETNGLYRRMDVEEYVLGVLPGTIPADYDEEVLKVQAMLIRTNVLKEMQEKGTNDAADLSYEYLTVEDQIALFGEHNYEKYQQRFEKAVVKTAGKVIMSENEYIMALYHEVSIEKTASAKEILAQDISYLQSVESSRDVEAKHYMNTVFHTWEELQQINQQYFVQGDSAETEENAEKQKEETGSGAEGSADGQSTETIEKMKVSVDESTENGYVKKVSVNGTSYTADEVLEPFGLTSTNFYVEEMEDGIRFVCLGKGNGMGVSQYGANRMALEGRKAEEIIEYYYEGVSIVDCQK